MKKLKKVLIILSSIAVIVAAFVGIFKLKNKNDLANETAERKMGIYERYVKRKLDVIISLCAIIVLSPVYIILIILGAIFMGGNPFFTQERPGLNEKIFKMIKFRTMSNKKDKDGNLLPDEDRLNAYGKFLRSTSLDEIPELFNIIKGDMSLVGPRPLLVKYLDRYNEEQRHRHDVKPGLTGWAQINGRNSISWEEKFKLDIYYVQNLTFKTDIRILIDTILVVINRKNINSDSSATMEEFMGDADKSDIEIKGEEID